MTLQGFLTLRSIHRPRYQLTRGLIGLYNKIENLISKLNFYKLIPYLVDRCICPALCRSRQTLEKNVLSWALAGTGSVLFTRQVAVQPTYRYTAHARACALPLFVVYLMTPCWL